MAAWGAIFKHDKPYTFRFDGVPRRLRLSKAKLVNRGHDRKERRKAVQFVRCAVGKKAAVVICTLTMDGQRWCNLDLEFEETDDIVFSVSGGFRRVKLSGYYIDWTTTSTNITEDLDNDKYLTCIVKRHDIGSVAASDQERDVVAEESEVGKNEDIREGQEKSDRDFINQDEKPTDNHHIDAAIQAGSKQRHSIHPYDLEVHLAKDKSEDSEKLRKDEEEKIGTDMDHNIDKGVGENIDHATVRGCNLGEVDKVFRIQGIHVVEKEWKGALPDFDENKSPTPHDANTDAGKPIELKRKKLKTSRSQESSIGKNMCAEDISQQMGCSNEDHQQKYVIHEINSDKYYQQKSVTAETESGVDQRKMTIGVTKSTIGGISSQTYGCNEDKLQNIAVQDRQQEVSLPSVASEMGHHEESKKRRRKKKKEKEVVISEIKPEDLKDNKVEDATYTQCGVPQNECTRSKEDLLPCPVFESGHNNEQKKKRRKKKQRTEKEVEVSVIRMDNVRDKSSEDACGSNCVVLEANESAMSN